MSHRQFLPVRTPCGHSRREFLWQTGAGFTGLGLIDLLSRDGFFENPAHAAPVANPLLAPKPQMKPARAKHCVFLFMNGAPSQVDTFDPKPALSKYDGKKYEGNVKVGSNGRPIGYLTQTAFQFKQHGESGLPISDTPFIAAFAANIVKDAEHRSMSTAQPLSYAVKATLSELGENANDAQHTGND